MDKKYFHDTYRFAGMIFAIAGCGAGGKTENDSAETVQTAGAQTAEVTGAVKEQDMMQEEAEPVQDKVQDPQEWEWDAADEQTLRYAFAKEFGGRAGVCIPMAALSDGERIGLVKDQFNSITMENEMKPIPFWEISPISEKMAFRSFRLRFPI